MLLLSAVNQTIVIVISIVLAVLLIAYLLFYFSRIKKCPPDKMMVIYGKIKSDKDGNARSSICVHGGVVFVWPIIQNYQFLDLNPIKLNLGLKNVLNKQLVEVNIDADFSVAISTLLGNGDVAAQHLLGLTQEKIAYLAEDIIKGQMRVLIAETDIEEICFKQNHFFDSVCRSVEIEINKIGLTLINANLEKLSDNDGIIETEKRNRLGKT